MQVTITKTHQTHETIDITLPYYFKHDLALDHCDHVVYGKIEEKTVTKITIATSHISDRVSSEVETESIDWPGYSCYLTEQHKGTKEEYETAKAKALNLLNHA